MNDQQSFYRDQLVDQLGKLPIVIIKIKADADIPYLQVQTSDGENITPGLIGSGFVQPRFVQSAKLMRLHTTAFYPVVDALVRLIGRVPPMYIVDGR
jgi:hypothetical protein